MPLIRLDSSSPRIADTGWRGGGEHPTLHLIAHCDGARLLSNNHLQRIWQDPLDALAWMADTFPQPGRWIGYLSYDLGRHFETLPHRPLDDLPFPLFEFTFHPDPLTTTFDPPHDLPPPPVIAQPAFTRDQYEAAVARAIEYIRAGDIFQVNLAQRFTIPCTSSPHALYARLLRDAPADYGALLDYGDHALVCNSPELFLHVDPSRRVITRPIKGTRPRLPGMHEQLLHSIKDQAELHMIVDLERNDLGRVCEIGSVKVIQSRVIESHPTVYHGVATIEGRLRTNVGLVDLLRATFPGGSITGAPKIRAMQIIEELEPVHRGPYCGAIGYVASNGVIHFNIAIRTILLAAGLAHVSVGGGIVADSAPPAEYEETLTKAQALFQALAAH